MKLLFSLYCLFYILVSLIQLSSTQLETESTSSVRPPQVDLCPTPSEIEPCLCHTTRKPFGLFFQQGPSINLYCNGENVTELRFDKVIKALHQKAEKLVQNPIYPESEKVNNSRYLIWLYNTSISQLDLTSLIQTSLKVYELRLTNNAKLSTITGPLPSSLLSSNKIPCHFLSIWNSPLKDADIGKILSFLAPETLKILEVTGTLVEGSGGKLENKNKDCPANPLELEFFPGLSTFENLEYIWLDRNKIKVIRCSPFFAQGRNLKDLGLYSNPLEYVGENGLLFSSPEVPTSTPTPTQNPVEPNTEQSNNYRSRAIHVSIKNSSLDENTFMGDSGLDKNPQHIFLRLRDNKFQSLPETLFRPFLEKPGNYFQVYEPLLSCDEKSKWVQEFPLKSIIGFGKQKCESVPHHNRNRRREAITPVTKTIVSD